MKKILKTVTKSSLPILCSILLSVSTLFAKGLEKKVSIATCNWEPYVGETLKDYGFTSVIITKAFKRVGYQEVNFTFLPWPRVLSSVMKNQYDLASSAYYSNERAQEYDYSNPYINSIVVLYKMKYRNIKFDVVEDLHHLSIGVVMGYVNIKQLDNTKEFILDPAPEDKLNILKLLAKRVDVAIIDMYVAESIISKIPGAKQKLDYIKNPLKVHPVHLIGNKKAKKTKTLLRDFNKGLELIKAEEVYTKIFYDYGFDPQIFE